MWQYYFKGNVVFKVLNTRTILPSLSWTNNSCIVHCQLSSRRVVHACLSCSALHTHTDDVRRRQAVMLLPHYISLSTLFATALASGRIGLLSNGYRGWGNRWVKLATHLHPVSRPRMRWASRSYRLYSFRTWRQIYHCRTRCSDFFLSFFESTGFVSRPGYRNLDLGVVTQFT
jgi:hypothetical protein